ncbi:hypothetical protein [Mycobacteroides salmoniphilum]|uniref:hypothetical protein n=1 Tax=Mycobacteroides salmoniphilum TaxID=404941 RepID=UPI000992E071|nr:hypothetical protein [Mycobacteroides salmoniphilum]
MLVIQLDIYTVTAPSKSTSIDPAGAILFHTSLNGRGTIHATREAQPTHRGKSWPMGCAGSQESGRDCGYVVGGEGKHRAHDRHLITGRHAANRCAASGVVAVV